MKKNIFKKAVEGIKNAGKKTVEFVKDNRDTITMTAMFVGTATLVSVGCMVMNKKAYKRGVREGVIDASNNISTMGVTDAYYICSQHTDDGDIYRVLHGHSADGKIVPATTMYNSIVACNREHDKATDTSFDIENYLDSGINISAELSDNVECKGDYVEFKPTE